MMRRHRKLPRCRKLARTMLDADMVLFLLVGIMVFVSESVSGFGFQPSALMVRRHTAPRFPSRSDVFKATLQEEELMTEDEEKGLADDDVVLGIMPTGSLDYYPTNPLINDLQIMRKELKNCPQMWEELAKYCPDTRALLDEHHCEKVVDVTFAEMYESVQKSAAIFTNLGLKKGDKVAVFGENSALWLMVDHGIQMAGGASVVRGEDAPLDELRYIYDHSDSAGIAVLQGPRLLNKLAKDAKAKGLTRSSRVGLTTKAEGPVNTIVLIHHEKFTNEEITKLGADLGVKIHVFTDLLDTAKPFSPDCLPNVGKDDLATLVYTSGTTGRPKGVMLTHGNLLHQCQQRVGRNTTYEKSDPLPGEVMLALLPVWHITERAFELIMFAHGVNVVYSSIRTFRNDLATHKPQWLVLVPRVLEKIALGVQDKFSSSAAVKTLAKIFTKTGSLRAKHTKIAHGLVIGDEPPTRLQRLKSKALVSALAPMNAIGDRIVWSKVKNGFGGRLRVIFAGGSALAGSLESFYETCGIPICVGYGMTESAPVISFRQPDSNLVAAGCAGHPALDTEVRIVDPDSKVGDAGRKALPGGTPGVILARGPQITKGYYKDPKNTAKAIDKLGWFDTGDLGLINPATGDLIVTGRAKDTIVLSDGENIEPVPLEDAILGESPLIEQVMLVGQDGRRLMAIAVLIPDELVKAGFLDAKEGEELQEQYDKLNDPRCTEEECTEACRILNDASDRLRENEDLKANLQAAARKATSPFRNWEQVSVIYLTLEPFAMANGQLTQSYKVKRASVTERYMDSLPT